MKSRLRKQNHIALSAIPLPKTSCPDDPRSRNLRRAAKGTRSTMESGTNRTKIAIVRRQWLSSQRLNSQLLSNLLRKSLSHGLHKSGNVVALLLGVLALLGVTASAQTSSQLPFDVSNPKHLDWPTDEANRIYASACELVARSIRPEK